MTHHDSEVLSCDFSPDGVFLACARDDNVAHVWDSRFIRQSTGPLRILNHGDGDGTYRYGVTAMSWLAHEGPSSAPVLVTGGNDGGWFVGLLLIVADLYYRKNSFVGYAQAIV